MSNTPPQRIDDEFDSTKDVVAYGFATFAGVLLATLSVFQILEGIAALANDKVYVRGLSYTYEFDVTTWGWIHLIIGLVGLATGIGILMGQAWGRILGILIAVLSALSNFAFVPYYPFWSLAIIALDVFVIWALCTQMASERP
jgi:hypothetical protein